MKRLLAVLLVIALFMGLVPITALAADETQAQAEIPKVFSEEDYAVTNLLWDDIHEMEARLATKDGEKNEEMIAAAAELILTSENYLEGSLEYCSNCLKWKTIEGIACIYLFDDQDNHHGESIGNPIEVPESGYEHISYATKGRPNGADVYLVGPYYGIDSNFTDYYKTEAKAVAAATGGTYTLYSGYSVTIDKVATAISNGAIVLIDSHGTYDDSQSYLRLTSGTGITSADYNGSAYYNSNGEYMVTGKAIANHMTKDAPNSFVWFGICSGMRFNTMHKPLMARGVEATFGYSRTISFNYDRYWLSPFLDELIAGKTVASAAATMKKEVGYWDHYNESAYSTISLAQSAGLAFPIFVSAEDPYPSTLQTYQTVKSTWVLYSCSHSSLNYVAATAATCTTSGNKAYYKCSSCNTLFLDSAAASQTTLSAVTIAATGHSFSGGICTKCGAVSGVTLWHFWQNSAEANYSWIAVDTNNGAGSPVITTNGRGTISSTSNGNDHYFYMYMGTGSMGHTVASGDVIEVRYKTTAVPSSLLNTSGTFELWYTTTANDSSFSSSMKYTASVTYKENQWQTIQFTPSTGITLKRILFDFLEENKGFAGTTIEIDYLYVGPSATAPSKQATDHLFFDFTNDGEDHLRYSGSIYGDHNFDAGRWYVGTYFSSQKIDTASGTFIGTMSDSATTCVLRTAVNASSSEYPLEYRPNSDDYFQAKFKIEGAQAATDQINLDFYFYTTNDNSWHYARTTASKSMLGDYFIASIPMSSNTYYQNAGTITSIQMSIGTFQSVSGGSAVVTVDYIYLGKNPPNAVSHNYISVVTAPTCTEQGYTTHTCSDCGYSYVSDYVNALNHANTITQTINATCTESGEFSVICNDCGKVLSQQIIAATGHVNTITQTIDATCTSDGEILVICDDCGKTISKEILPATGHNVVNGYCSLCGTKYAGTLLHFKTGSPELSFAWNLLHHCDTPTFDTSGTGYMKGTISSPGGNVRSDVYVGMQASNNPDNLNHKLLTADEVFQIRFKLDLNISIPDNSITKFYLKTSDVAQTGGYTETYQVSTDTAVTDAEGYSIATMTIPSDLVGKTIETLRLDFLDGIGLAAFEGSYTVDYIYLGPGCTAPNAVHSYTYKASTNPSTTRTGLLTGTCAHCSATTTVTLPKLNTTDYTKTVTKAATCTTTGTDSYKWNTTTYGSFTFTTATAALGHSYTSKVTAPTCTAQGYTTHTCSRCFDTYQDAIVAAKGHTEVIDKAVAATCTEAGKTEGKHCSVCNAVLVAQTTVPAKGHTEVIDEAVAATCTETGLTEGKHCSVCNEILVAQESVPSAKHEIELVEYVEPTCTEDGCREHWFCNVCSTSFADAEGAYPLPDSFFITAATGHSVTYIDSKDATCTEFGFYEHYYCSKCNSRFFDAECKFIAPESYIIISATGHSYTYINNGTTHTVTCKNCDLSDTISHSYQNSTCICGAVENTEPVYVLDESLGFSMNISAGAEMQVRYTILNARVSSFESFYLAVTKAVAGGEPVVTTYEVEDMTAYTTPAGAVTAYQATYEGINAKEMGDEFTTVLYAVASDGTIHYSTANTASMKSYLIEKFNAESSSDTLKTMCIDMLNYGAAAQIRLDYDAENLVNADLTEAQLAYATKEIPTAVNGSTSTGNGANLISNVSVQSKVLLYINCVYAGTNTSELKYVVKDAETGETLETLTANKLGTVCQAVYGNVGAKQMRQLITVTLYDGDTAVSQTLTWSVESYVASVRAKTNATEAELNMANAMLTYGDSVAAYMLETNQ